MSALGLFDRLPLELRQNVYTALYKTTIHCCCCLKYHAEYRKDGNSPVASDLLAGYRCANQDIGPILKQGTWSATATDTHRDCPGWSPFTFLRTSKAIYQEAESIAWASITLSVGLPQLKYLFDKHLQQPVRSSENQESRYKLPRHLHLTAPHIDVLAKNISKSSKSHGLSGLYLSQQSCRESSKSLSKFTNLNSIVLVVPELKEISAWEFQRYFQVFVYNTPQMAKLSIHVFQGDNKVPSFVQLDQSFWDGFEKGNQYCSSRLLGAMLLSAKDMLKTGVSLPSWIKISELDANALSCVELLDSGEHPFASDTRMESWKARVCNYLQSVPR